MSSNISISHGTYSYENVPTSSAHDVLDRLATEHDPDNVYVAVSGGDDSITTLHFVANSNVIDVDGVVHIDTGIGVGKTREFVEDKCEELGLDLIVLDDQAARYGHERYEFLVKTHGFPGANPIAHSQMWQNLKDKPMGKLQSHLDGDLALISGVRKHESETRYERLSHTGIQDVGGITWASPLVDFTDKDLKTYREYHDIEENPVAALLCTSGECLCGSYGDRNNLPLIKQYFPEVAQQIFRLENEVLDRVARGEIPKEYALWAHGSVDSGEYEARTDANQTGLTCSDCDDQCPTGGYEMTGDPLSPAEDFLRSNDLSEYWNWPFYCAKCDQVVQEPYTHRQEAHPFDADAGLESEWDMRKIKVGVSHRTNEIVTEPNGWNIHSNQLTMDESEAERYKSKYYYENVAHYLCDDGEHEWEPYNGGPVQQCTECYAFNLTDYDPTDPGPPVVPPESELDDVLSTSEEEAREINKQLSEFR